MRPESFRAFLQYLVAAMNREKSVVSQSESYVRSLIHPGSAEDFFAIPDAADQTIAGLRVDAAVEQRIRQPATKCFVVFAVQVFPVDTNSITAGFGGEGL